jgi:hypothetical protein
MPANNYTDRIATTQLVRTTDLPDGVLQADFACSGATVGSVDAGDGVKYVALAKASRRGFIIYNDSTCAFLIKYGNSPTTSSYTERIEPGTRWVMPFPIYTGMLSGIFDTNGISQTARPGIVNGSIMTTELYSN